jgi:hypothetical protein
MRPRAFLPFLLGAGTLSCLYVYHPEFHPEISTRYAQNISYPVTALRTLSSGTETTRLTAPARQPASAAPSTRSERVPPPRVTELPAEETPPVTAAKARHASCSMRRYVANRGLSPDGLGTANVTASRMGIPLPPRSKDCMLGLFHSAFVDTKEYQQVGVVQIVQAPIDTDPIGAPVRAVVREHACELGGSFVALTSSSKIVPPTAPSAASAYMMYSVYADKPADDGPTLF